MSNFFKPVFDLEDYFDKKVHIRFLEGREVSGVLKGYDSNSNCVLDQAIEYLTDANGNLLQPPQIMFLGLMFCKGSSITSIFPEEGSTIIENK
ncbi:u6 snRNA-associated sm-like protein lsm7 [Anaeramoeba flamelloides]|uniref:U6 snRNA-associated sm-like protein lsm7 n=1 Tax=Anaeramoeba flamelloides TaxID=1746091 RepID=A0AAV7ZSQ8_9EUKA|nr:u6 snRNA-associated sm-like protein lsm7 [Anaeramoeba flamelloides]KAJ3444835.1 u6 snRNA-associated sm-like protein lsm7 [Anaeramoeba flamelloides]KAJ6226474.1 u6 snRNA-associated sm-like protein lsm7 [Anaeramoeba flamelloides]KAJ6252359.1 u6 snRNA-associated sm-like protein lsm7 [Anaeramoeba flamelloides]